MKQEFIPQLPTSAVKRGAVIAPSDTDDLPVFSHRGIYVGVSGDVKVDLADGGAAIVFKAVPVGKLDIVARHVYATGTTATNLVALY